MAAQSNIEQLQERNFLYIVPSDNPLVRVENPKIIQNMIDPTTGNPYENGIVLEGEFASLDVLNNNNRIYTEEQYLPFIEDIKRRIWSPDGVFGELEHPKGYATDTNNVSHKLLDIWYDKAKKKVFGIVLVLDTAKGKIVKEIIKSGGRIGISARAGGKEYKNPDGTIKAELKMMVTFDLVYHPGFTTARMSVVNLNENDGSLENTFSPKKTFTIYETNLGKLDELYESYLLDKENDLNFLEWVDDRKLFENAGPKFETEEQQAQQKLQNNQNNNEDEVEQQLSDAVDQDLSEKQVAFNEEMQKAQLSLGRKMRAQANASKSAGKYKKQGNSYYDGSAGFVGAMSQDEEEVGFMQEDGFLFERDFSTKQRKQLAKEGKALPDGSFPIENEKDLANAIKLVGMAKNKQKAKAWVIKRAVAMGKMDMVPESWGK